MGYLPNDIDHLDDDNGFPIWRYSNKALETRYVSEVTHLKKYDTNHICMRNPRICNISASFLIDKSHLAHEKDVLCNLHGHWKLSKTKKFNFCIDRGSLFKVSVNTVLPKGVALSAARSMYYDRFRKDFYKVLVSIDGSSIAYLQYYLDNDAKKVIAFIRTKLSVVEKNRNSGKLPKTIVSNVLQESDGFEGVQGQNDLVRNRPQTYNAKSRVKEEKDEVVKVMDLYKRERKSEVHFIREINLAPEVSEFVSTEQQLIDIDRFCTKTSHYFILGFDATNNIGSYYVTIST